MIISISYDSTELYTLVKLRGNASSQDIVDAYTNIVNYANKRDCKKLLVDVTELEFAYSASELVTVVERIQPLLHDFKIARLIGLDGYFNNLLLQKAHRKNLTTENFECFKEAKMWLNAA